LCIKLGYPRCFRRGLHATRSLAWCLQTILPRSHLAGLFRRPSRRFMYCNCILTTKVRRDHEFERARSARCAACSTAHCPANAESLNRLGSSAYVGPEVREPKHCMFILSSHIRVEPSILEESPPLAKTLGREARGSGFRLTAGSTS
jgi:hypothetical protein